LCYIEESGNTTFIKVDSNTCDAMNMQCSPFFSAISKVDRAIETAFESYTDLITPPSFMNPCALAHNKDCKKFICDILISGQRTDYTVGGIDNDTATDWKKRINQNDDNNNEQDNEDDNYSVKLKMFGLSEQFTKSLDVLHDQIMEISRTALQQRRYTNTGINNVQYTLEGGYDVYFIGQQSNLDTNLIDSASSSTLLSWLSFGFIFFISCVPYCCFFINFR